MNDFFSHDEERSESYRILADLFLRPPDDTDLDVIKTDFSLKAPENAAQAGEEFAALFAYPGGALQPVASSFAQEVHASAPDIIEFYSMAGLILDETYGLPPDHLVTELLFMSYLIGTRENSLQKIFLEQHMMNWVPYFCDAVTEKAKTVFYREIAEILKDFLTSEYEEFLA